MSVQFKAIPKKNPQDRTAPVKYYATSIQKEVIDIDELCELISSNSTLSRSDIYGVVLELIDKINYELKSGRSVLINKLGQFNLSLSSTGVEDESELNASHIKAAKINFRPGNELRDMLKTLRYTKVN